MARIKASDFSIDTAEYESKHGKPKGRKTWTFSARSSMGEMDAVDMEYAEAAEAAIEWAWREVESLPESNVRESNFRITLVS